MISAPRERSQSIRSICRVNTAQCIGRLPILSAACTSSILSPINSFTFTPSKSLIAAAIPSPSSRTPYFSRIHRSNHSVSSLYPRNAAASITGIPNENTGRMPRSNKYFTTSMRFSRMAKCIGVKYSSSQLNNAGSRASNRRIEARSPFIAATNIAHTSTPRPRLQGRYASVFNTSGSCMPAGKFRLLIS